jgi:hypothetical protein
VAYVIGTQASWAASTTQNWPNPDLTKPPGMGVQSTPMRSISHCQWEAYELSPLRRVRSLKILWLLAVISTQSNIAHHPDIMEL